MSASREKKARQELNESGYVDPRKAREAEEKAKERRSTRIYTAVIVAFVLLGVVLFASGRIQASNEAKETARIGAESAVTIDGEDFSVNDVAYYYGSIYNTFANNGSSFGFDSSKSAREQQYTEGKTWHDYFLESALDYMKESVAVAHAAEAAGFDGAEQMDAAEQSLHGRPLCLLQRRDPRAVSHRDVRQVHDRGGLCPLRPPRRTRERLPAELFRQPDLLRRRPAGRL